MLGPFFLWHFPGIFSDKFCKVQFNLTSPHLLGWPDRLQGGNYTDLFILFYFVLFYLFAYPFFLSQTHFFPQKNNAYVI